MIDQIRAAVHGAVGGKQKIAMFHFQVLKNAEALEGFDSAAFCREVGVPESYRTEFSKMLGLARLMRERGVTLNGA